MAERGVLQCRVGDIWEGRQALGSGEGSMSWDGAKVGGGGWELVECLVMGVRRSIRLLLVDTGISAVLLASVMLLVLFLRPVVFAITVVVGPFVRTIMLIVHSDWTLQLSSALPVSTELQRGDELS